MGPVFETGVTLGRYQFYKVIQPDVTDKRKAKNKSLLIFLSICLICVVGINCEIFRPFVFKTHGRTPTHVEREKVTGYCTKPLMNSKYLAK